MGRHDLPRHTQPNSAWNVGFGFIDFNANGNRTVSNGRADLLFRPVRVQARC